MAGNRISTQTGIGTGIAIAGVAMYSLIKANMEEQKRVSFLPDISKREREREAYVEDIKANKNLKNNCINLNEDELMI